VQSNWYETFFEGIALDLWNSFASDEFTGPEVDFLLTELAVQKGGRILNVPCGNGRHSIPLAKRGLSVTGFDIAPEQISHARAAAAAAAAGKNGVDATYEVRDMRDLPRDGTFDGAFCFGNSFGYLDDDGCRAFLSAVARSLKPGARFCLDGACAELLLAEFQEQRWYEVGDILFFMKSRHVARTSRIETTYSFIRDGMRTDRDASIGVYTLRELAAMFEAAGFTDFRAYGSLERKEFALGDQRMLLSARTSSSTARLRQSP